jgi:N-acetylglucosaminyldiphosphoundecaprenol N-acetyl-beta-D-mannosaminyltransferase
MTSDYFKIFDVKISCSDSYRDAYNRTVSRIGASKGSSYVTINNVHVIVEACLDPHFREVINSSNLSLADGRPLTLYAKYKYRKRLPRIFGPTFFEKAIEWGQEDGIRHYFFGSTDVVLTQMRSEIERRFPRAKIAGMEAPGFGEFSKEQNDRYLRKIMKSSADIIWVGLGAPKQETWIYQNYQELEGCVLIGIGAGFSYVAGRTRHAPEWMKNYALEWLFRLCQEPGRLWNRYLKYNLLFFWFLALESLGIVRHISGEGQGKRR